MKKRNDIFTTIFLTTFVIILFLILTLCFYFLFNCFDFWVNTLFSL